MNAFKLPQSIPQDLLLICDLIGVSNDAPSLNHPSSTAVRTDDSIDSSDSEIASEDEIEAVLIPVNDEDRLQGSKSMHVASFSPLLFRLPIQ
jgi:H/ACA ribonucleoprotein complex non-core subunit NAF1